jgi:HEXXH motif-containing protein
MKLTESLWVIGGGRTPEWRRVHERRLEDVRRGLRGALARLAREAPAPVRKRRYAAALRFLASARGPAAERALEHPALDYWLSLWNSHFSAAKIAAEDWHLQFGLLGGFAAALALEQGKNLACDAVLDPDGSFYLYGSPWAFDFTAASRAPIAVTVERGVLNLKGDGLEAEFDPRTAAHGGPLRRLDEVVPGVVVDDRGWLQVHGVTMHGLARLDDAGRARFAAVIRRALLDMAARDPRLHAEMADLLRVVIPLQNPQDHGSVSSSYATLRGMIALSHAEDPLLQAETLIHEFCHMKMNQLLAADPVLLPGQSGQAYYSPWRPDARRLRGLMIGAHAFLNVARYLARSLEREEYPDETSREIMTNVARRLFQVEIAMKGVIENAALTAFGREFVLGMWRELGLLRHAVLWFPSALVAEQFAECEAHRARHALAGTSLHKTAELLDRVPRARFTAPRAPVPQEGSA